MIIAMKIKYAERLIWLAGILSFVALIGWGFNVISMENSPRLFILIGIFNIVAMINHLNSVIVDALLE